MYAYYHYQTCCIMDADFNMPVSKVLGHLLYYFFRRVTQLLWVSQSWISVLKWGPWEGGSQPWRGS